MLPVFSNLIQPDPEMTALIDRYRAPHLDKLEEQLAITDVELYRRGNFNGSFDQVIVDAMLKVRDAEIAFSPGFRWGTSLLPGDPITFERVMDQTAITYPKSTLTDMTGAMIKDVLEDIANNLFNPDPYLQMGGGMVRIGGLSYSIDPTQPTGSRLSDLTLGGKPIDPNKTYKVAGWASVQEQPDELPDIWDVVSEYLRDKKVIDKVETNVPVVKGIDNNPGLRML
jgi:S-sulfosulfanyl-L-cysteine sulfohydrolase